MKSTISFIARLVLALLPFAIFGLMYFSMGFFPSYKYNDIDIRGLYEAEESLFGFLPCEYFAQHNCAVLDFIAGISYLSWLPLPIAFAIILFCQKKSEWCVRFTLCFLLCNVIGIFIYYIHPAAPPWYVMKYGFEPIFNTPGDAGGLIRFDELIGIPVFQSIYSGNSNVFAAVPSLHVAYMFIATIYAVMSSQSRVLIAVFELVTLGIWFTAVYSGHHYVIDVVLGIATALLSVIIMETVLVRIPCVSNAMLKYSQKL
ncbi:MAG: phosphatase PAP2 family protein [Prevotellaceae bacterium]|nr:phosphatase PAP2 family protein [Prevotellaceae bacterium]